MKMTRTEIATYGIMVALLTAVSYHTLNVENEKPELRQHVCSTLPQPHPDCP